jgi:hypothetical protein
MNRKMIGEVIYIRVSESRAEGNNTECVGKKRFNGRVLPTGFGKSMCYVPPICHVTSRKLRLPQCIMGDDLHINKQTHIFIANHRRLQRNLGLEVSEL